MFSIRGKGSVEEVVEVEVVEVKVVEVKVVEVDQDHMVLTASAFPLPPIIAWS